jgi:hypothetical protein
MPVIRKFSVEAALQFCAFLGECLLILGYKLIPFGFNFSAFFAKLVVLIVYLEFVISGIFWSTNRNGDIFLYIPL